MLWLCRVSCPIVDNLNKALQVTHNGSGKAKSESPRDFLSFSFARLIVCCSFRGWVGELKSNKVSRLKYNQTPLIFQFDREPFPKKKIKKEKKKKLFQAFFFFLLDHRRRLRRRFSPSNKNKETFKVFPLDSGTRVNDWKVCILNWETVFFVCAWKMDPRGRYLMMMCENATRDHLRAPLSSAKRLARKKSFFFLLRRQLSRMCQC